MIKLTVRNTSVQLWPLVWKNGNVG